ncbi:MAG TPA: hypothetical protein VGR51_03735 [Thermoplasmata archaeon]|nr:hypothetical protein [Thermoplasmata archaeon]
MYLVFDVKAPRAQIDQLLGSVTDPRADVVTRQSIMIREGRALGFPDHGNLVVIEGTEAGLAAATELFKDVGAKLDGPRAEAVYRAIRAQEDDAASGLGLIFG